MNSSYHEPLHGEGHRFESGRAHLLSVIYYLIARYFEESIGQLQAQLSEEDKLRKRVEIKIVM